MSGHEVSDVEVFGYYDGVLSGALTLDGKRCEFDLAPDCEPTDDKPRWYAVTSEGEFVATVTEQQINAGRAS